MPAADELLDSLCAPAGFSAEATEQLWRSVPEGLRLVRFDPATVPVEYRNAFGQVPGGSFVVDLSALPPPMQHEVAWCLFRMVELGGRVFDKILSVLVHRLSEAVVHLGQDRLPQPQSLMDLTLSTWHREIAGAVARRRTALPPPALTRNFRAALRRCYHLLWSAAHGGNARSGTPS